MNVGFLRPDEAGASAAFLDQGHLIAPVEDRDALDRLRGAVAALAARHLDRPEPDDAGRFLDEIHTLVEPGDLNALRLAAIEGINGLDWARELYFGLAQGALELLVGNELAMQRRLNLSIQLPGDSSSLLPVHADVWNGDSPFEIVIWLPLVDCHGSKSMFLLPPGPDEEIRNRFGDLAEASAEDLFHRIEPDLIWLDVPYGNVLLFTQTLMHGNRVNREDATRWSMNCRFKSLFSPYADKRMGEFFEPIIIRAATRIGMRYQLPGGFAE